MEIPFIDYSEFDNIDMQARRKADIQEGVELIKLLLPAATDRVEELEKEAEQLLRDIKNSNAKYSREVDDAIKD